jgi:hypothetical protein
MTTELMQRNAQLSTLSNLAYKENPPDSTNGWTRMTIAPNTASGFSAVAYRNSNGEVAIAFRGTDSLKDMVTNGAFVSNGWRQQFSDAADFVNKVKLEMRDQGISGSPIVTGHSLGGGIAQVMGKMFGLNGAAFDAPGAAGVTQSAGFSQTAAQYGQSTGEYGQPPANQIGADFTNFNSQGSAISAAGSHLGQFQSFVNLPDPQPGTAGHRRSGHAGWTHSRIARLYCNRKHRLHTPGRRYRTGHVGACCLERCARSRINTHEHHVMDASHRSGLAF